MKHLLHGDDDGLQGLLDAELRDRIGASFMGYTWHDSVPEQKAFGHRGNRPTDNEAHDDNFGAAYSLNISALDYARFVRFLIEEHAAGSPAATEMLAIQTSLPAEEGELHRSLGFPVKRTDRGVRYYHSGNNGDFRAYVHLHADQGDGIVLLSNSDRFFQFQPGSADRRVSQRCMVSGLRKATTNAQWRMPRLGRMSLDANSVIGLAHSLVDRKIAG